MGYFVRSVIRGLLCLGQCVRVCFQGWGTTMLLLLFWLAGRVTDRSHPGS